MKNCCIALMQQAVAAGYVAVKLEMLFYEQVRDREIVKFIHQCRQIVSEEREIIIDVGYRWKNWNDALCVLPNVEDAKLLFVETPLHTDDLARLADAHHASGGW